MLTIVNNKNGADLTWGRFDLGSIWFGADLTCFHYIISTKGKWTPDEHVLGQTYPDLHIS